MEAPRGCLGVELDGEQGVGGSAGIKNDGMVATDD